MSFVSENSPERDNANDCQDRSASGQLHNATEVKVTKTEKGKQCIMENGYMYTMHRTKGDDSQWQCVEINSCKARIHITGSVITKRTNEHLHEPNCHRFHCNEVKAGVKRRASETQEPTHSIVASQLTNLSDESAIYLPKLDSFKKTICRARRKAANVPLEATSLDNLELPEVYKRTNKGEPFLHHDSGSAAQNTRILILGTKSNVEIVNTSSVWLADRTFKSAPNLFYQLYVVHALKGGPDPKWTSFAKSICAIAMQIRMHI